jgi:hypothetical protein
MLFILMAIEQQVFENEEKTCLLSLQAKEGMNDSMNLPCAHASEFGIYSTCVASMCI